VCTVGGGVFGPNSTSIVDSWALNFVVIGTKTGRLWGVLCGQCPALCTVPQRMIPGNFLLVENGRLEPRGWNPFQRGFKHTHQ
jgi:hypothetical protein